MPTIDQNHDVFLVIDNGFGTEGDLHRENRSVLVKWSYLLGM